MWGSNFYLAKKAKECFWNSEADRSSGGAEEKGPVQLVEFSVAEFIQFICILILKFKTRPNTSLCEIEQRERTCCSSLGWEEV